MVVMPEPKAHPRQRFKLYPLKSVVNQNLRRTPRALEF
ncbi:hypothetical protein V6Z11_D02G100000 [Gossypium hirsutum]